MVEAETRDFFEKKILKSILVSTKLEENIISNLPPSPKVSPTSVLTFDLKWNLDNAGVESGSVMFVRISNVNKWSTFCR